MCKKETSERYVNGKASLSASKICGQDKESPCYNPNNIWSPTRPKKSKPTENYQATDNGRTYECLV